MIDLRSTDAKVHKPQQVKEDECRILSKGNRVALWRVVERKSVNTQARYPHEQRLEEQRAVQIGEPVQDQNRDFGEKRKHSALCEHIELQFLLNRLLLTDYGREGEKREQYHHQLQQHCPHIQVSTRLDDFPVLAWRDAANGMYVLGERVAVASRSGPVRC